MHTSTSSGPPGPAQHASVKAADARRSLEQRLAAAEAICELVQHQLCSNEACDRELCRAIRTWWAFKEAHVG